MRILVLNWLDRENPQAGGAEIHLHEVFGRLVRRGHEVTLLCSGWPGAPERAVVDGIQVHRTGSRHTLNLAAPAYYLRRLRAVPFDVVVEDLNKVPFFSPLWIRRPLVLLVHHLFGATAFQEASPPFAAATWLLERPVPRLYRGVPTVAISRSTAEDLTARGLPREGIRVIENGVDPRRYSPDPEGRRFDEPTVLYLGRLKRYKRVDLVLRALARLPEAGIPARGIVAGKGDHAPALLRLRDELGLRERVDFRGFVPEEEKVRLLRRAWVHVLTSPKEGWGISNLEAAACGTPTVASDAPGLRDSVVDGRTGFLVPHGNVEVLADRLAALLRDRELRERMGREARRFAEAHSWDGTARRFEAFLEGGVARPGGRP